MLAGAALTGYAFAIEPGFRLRIQRHAFTPPNWTPGLQLKVVCLADPHLGEPHMPLSRWKKIIETANALKPDLVLLLGDYTASHRFVTRAVTVEDAARACTALVGAAWRLHHQRQPRLVVGRCRPSSASPAPSLRRKHSRNNGIRALVNEAERLEKDGMPFWLSGTDSIVAIRTDRPGHFEGRDNLAAALAADL